MNTQNKNHWKLPLDHLRTTIFATTINCLGQNAVLSLLAPTYLKFNLGSNTDYANITAIFQFVYADAFRSRDD
jgi:ACS family hexuronate transporter-like MFS transporter